MRGALQWIVRVTKPLVWRLAEAYDLRVARPPHASGQHPLILRGGERQARDQIPSSVYFNTRSGRIVVGENSVFGEDVMVLTGKHLNIEEARRDQLPLHHVPESGRDVTIGSGCYIGSGAIIIGPVEIGDQAVVGAGSVVTRNVPARSFAAGNPATVVRTLSAD